MSKTTEKKSHITPLGIAMSMRAAAEKLKSPSGVHAKALLHYQQRHLLKKQSIAEEKAKKQNPETFLVFKQSLKTEQEKKEEEEEIIKEILQMNEKHRISSTTYSILEEIEEERINVTKNQAKVATAHNSALAECKKGKLVMNELSLLGISMDISFLYRKAPREIPSWLEMFATLAYYRYMDAYKMSEAARVACYKADSIGHQEKLDKAEVNLLQAMQMEENELNILNLWKKYLQFPSVYEIQKNKYSGQYDKIYFSRTEAFGLVKWKKTDLPISKTTCSNKFSSRSFEQDLQIAHQIQRFVSTAVEPFPSIVVNIPTLITLPPSCNYICKNRVRTRKTTRVKVLRVFHTLVQFLRRERKLYILDKWYKELKSSLKKLSKYKTLAILHKKRTAEGNEKARKLEGVRIYGKTSLKCLYPTRFLPYHMSQNVCFDAAFEKSPVDMSGGRTDCVFATLEKTSPNVDWSEAVLSLTDLPGDILDRLLTRKAMMLSDFGLLSQATGEGIAVLLRLDKNRVRVIYYGCEFYTRSITLLLVNVMSTTHGHASVATEFQKVALEQYLVPIAYQDEIHLYSTLLIGGGDEIVEPMNGVADPVAVPLADPAPPVHEADPLDLPILVPASVEVPLQVPEPAPARKKKRVQFAPDTKAGAPEKIHVASAKERKKSKPRIGKKATDVPSARNAKPTESAYHYSNSSPYTSSLLSSGDPSLSDFSPFCGTSSTFSAFSGFSFGHPTFGDSPPSSTPPPPPPSPPPPGNIPGGVPKKPPLSHKERHVETRNENLHIRRTFGEDWRQLFGYSPSFLRGSQFTDLFSYTRAWRARAFENLPGCAAAVRPENRNGGGYLGGWSIIHAAAAALERPSEEVHMAISNYIASVAISTTDENVRNALFRFITPQCFKTRAILSSRGITPLKYARPGDCQFPARSTSDLGQGLVMTKYIETVIGDAICKEYRNTRFSVTRYDDEDAVAVLKDIALQQLDDESHLLISIVYEGPNMYGAAIIKRGALAARHARRTKLYSSVLELGTTAQSLINDPVPFDKALVTATVALSELLRDLMVERVDPTSFNPILVFIQESADERIINEKIKAEAKEREKKDEEKEKRKGIKVKDMNEEQKTAHKLAQTLARQSKKEGAKTDAIGEAKVQDTERIEAAIKVAVAERERRSLEAPLTVDQSWKHFFHSKHGSGSVVADSMMKIFTSSLEAACGIDEEQPKAVYISGSTSGHVAGFASGNPDDIDIYVDWQVPPDQGAVFSTNAVLEQSTTLETTISSLVASIPDMVVTFENKNYGLPLQAPPFGISSSGIMLEATITHPESASPMKLQFIFRNPAFSPHQIIALTYGTHLQVFHVWNNGHFEETLTDAAIQASIEKKTTLSPQYLLANCLQSLGRLRITSEQTAKFLQSIIRILADVVEPSNSDTDKQVLFKLREKNILSSVDKEKNDLQVQVLVELIVKRNLSYLKDNDYNRSQIRFVAKNLRKLTSRVYKNSVNGQVFDWRGSMLGLAVFLRDPVNADAINKQASFHIGGNIDPTPPLFLPLQVSQSLQEMARKAPSSTSSSRVAAKPAPAPTRPRKMESTITTMKKALFGSVKGTLEERAFICKVLRKEAETMAVVTPAACKIATAALLNYYESGIDPVFMIQKGTEAESSMKFYEAALTSGLRRTSTKKLAEKDPDKESASRTAIKHASDRFFDDPRNEKVVYPPRSPGDFVFIHRQAKFMAAEAARYFNMEPKGKLFNSIGSLFRRCIINLCKNNTVFGDKTTAWDKLARKSSIKALESIIQGLCNEVLHIRARGLTAQAYLPLDGVKSALVKKGLLNEDDAFPPFITSIVDSYKNVFWSKFTLGDRSETMRHAELKALMCEKNWKVECVGRLYHHILKLNNFWLAELTPAQQVRDGLTIQVQDFLHELAPAPDVNESTEDVDDLDERLHDDLEDIDEDEVDDDDIDGDIPFEDDDGDEENVEVLDTDEPMEVTSTLFSSSTTTTFDPFEWSRLTTPIFGKRFYPKSFYLLPQHKRAIRSIGVEGDFIEIAFKDLPIVKAVKAKAALIAAEGVKGSVEMAYMSAIFDRPIRLNESFGASIVTNGHFISILYNKTGSLPSTFEASPFYRDPNAPIFRRHADAERFDSSPGIAVRHWRRVVSVDPGLHNLLTCYEVLVNGTERVWKLTQEEYKYRTGYKRRMQRSTRWCEPLTATVNGVKGAFVQLSEPQAWGKTSSCEQFLNHMTISAAVSPSILQVTLQPKWADEAFRTWRAKKKTLDLFWSMIKAGSLNDGTQNVQPIIAFGDGQFASSMKGRLSAPTSALYKSCVRVNYQVNVVLVCEHRSTYTCASCTKPLQNLRKGSRSKADDAAEKKHFEDIQSGHKGAWRRFYNPMHKNIHGLKRCVNPSCPNHQHAFVDRDVNACRNILRSFHAADQVAQDPEDKNPSRPSHMDRKNVAEHAVERKNAPSFHRLPHRGSFSHNDKIPSGPGNLARREERRTAAEAEALKLNSTAPMTGPVNDRKPMFPESTIDEGKGGGSWRSKHWKLGPSKQPAVLSRSSRPYSDTLNEDDADMASTSSSNQQEHRRTRQRMEHAEEDFDMDRPWWSSSPSPPSPPPLRPPSSSHIPQEPIFGSSELESRRQFQFNLTQPFSSAPLSYSKILINSFSAGNLFGSAAVGLFSDRSKYSSFLTSSAFLADSPQNQSVRAGV
jgi:hypothetical protein